MKNRIKQFILVSVVFCIFVSVVFGAFDRDKPASSTSLRNSNPQILANWSALEDGIGREHSFLTGGAVAAQGEHTQGSAKAFSQASAPTTQVDGGAFAATDLGSIWVDTDDNAVYILTATTPTWTAISTEIITTLLGSARVFGSTLGVTGDFAVNTNKFTIAAASGNTLVAGTFESTGVTTLADASVTKTTAAPGADAQIANKKYVDDTPHTGGSVQVVNTQTGAVATGTTIMPFDDTIPQNTEGDEYMTLAITPTNASNKLKIEIIGHFSENTGGNTIITMALFQDATAGALAGTFSQNGTTFPEPSMHFTHFMAAGTTGETTFKVRAGRNSSGTTTFNGVDGARKLGGVTSSSITITEIKT
jgi:hypothetical protein